jgi:hypothetical protein
MMTSGMIRGRWHCVGVLACCLGAAMLQPGASFAQAPDDAGQREKQIVELKATIDQLIKEASDVASADNQKKIKQMVDELTAALADVTKAQAIGERVSQAIVTQKRATTTVAEQVANAGAQSQQQLRVILDAQNADVDKVVAEQLSAQAQLQMLGQLQLIVDDDKQAAEQLLVQAKLQKLGQLQQAAGERQGLQAELKEAEMKLEQANRQAQELKAKIRELTAKMKAEAAAKSAAIKEDGRMQLRLNFTTPEATEELLLRKVNGKWEVAPSPKSDQSRRTPGARIEATPMPGGRTVTVTPRIAEVQGVGGLKYRVESKTLPAPSSNSRIDELEKKIDKALQQVEQLRKQMNSRGKSGGRPEED